MKASELNQKAKEKMKLLDDKKYFAHVRQCDEEIRDNEFPFDRQFYLRQQDKLNEAYGEILIVYSQLRAKLKTYRAVRKHEFLTIKRNEVLKDNGKMPGDSILEDLANAEVSDLYNAVLVLEGWSARAEGSIRTCRSHIYSNGIENNDKLTPEGKDEKEPHND